MTRPFVTRGFLAALAIAIALPLYASTNQDTMKHKVRHHTVKMKKETKAEEKHETKAEEKAEHAAKKKHHHVRHHKTVTNKATPMTK